MTIGEKIKYFRKRIGITQAKLAELSGIHPVSIRKYETNKMVPQSPQIERLAEALGVSSFALTGFENNIRLETVGDFMGLMIMLIKSKIVIIDGNREENGMINPSTANFVVNPVITKFFTANTESTEISASKIMYCLNNENILSDILNWERINYRYEKIAAENGETSDKEFIKILDELKEQKEAVEMELQCSNIMLNADGHIGVKISSDYFN